MMRPCCQFSSICPLLKLGLGPGLLHCPSDELHHVVFSYMGVLAGSALGVEVVERDVTGVGLISTVMVVVELCNAVGIETPRLSLYPQNLR